MKNIILSLFFIIFFSSCRTHSDSMSKINSFIEQYENVEFANFADVSVTQIGRSGDDLIFLVSKFEGNMPGYFVTWNTKTETLIKVDKKNLIGGHLPDYFTERQIIDFVKKIRQYRFYLLGMDKDSNLYVNPFYFDEPVYFLRLKKATGDSLVRKGYVYELVRSRWYINTIGRRD